MEIRIDLHRADVFLRPGILIPYRLGRLNTSTLRDTARAMSRENMELASGRGKSGGVLSGHTWSE
jgi:hypothetical protein